MMGRLDEASRPIWQDVDDGLDKSFCSIQQVVAEEASLPIGQDADDGLDEISCPIGQDVNPNRRQRGVNMPPPP